MNRALLLLTVGLAAGLWSSFAHGKEPVSDVQRVTAQLPRFGEIVDRLPDGTEYLRANLPDSSRLQPMVTEVGKPARGQAIGPSQIQADTIGTHMQGGHSGGWFNSNQSGHGLFIEIIADNSSPTGLAVVAAWYAYEAGFQAWLLAVGDVVQEGSRHKAYLQAWIYNGNDFPPYYSANQTQEIEWGTLTLEFIGCNRANLTWNSVFASFGSGSLELERLTTIASSSCNPMLGGSSGGGSQDDHGNTWASGTSLGSNPSGSIGGQIDPAGDIDVFTFSLSSTLDVVLFSSGSTDTTGTLYRIVGSSEQEIQFNDDGGEGVNFNIEGQLSSGQYSLHVRGFGGTSTGPYTLNVQTSGGSTGVQRVVHFDNRLLMPVNVLLNGVPFGSVPPASAAQETMTVQPGDVFSFEVIQDYGDSMIGVYDPVGSGSGQLNLIMDTVLGDQWYFIPFFDNNSGENPLLAVNWELASQNLCNCTIPPFTSNVRAGYFLLWSNSNVALFFQQYGGQGWRWDNFANFVDPESGYIHFTYP